MENNILRTYTLLLLQATLIRQCFGQTALLTIIGDKCITNTSSAMAMIYYPSDFTDKEIGIEASQIKSLKKNGDGIKGMCVEPHCFNTESWYLVNSLEQGNVDNLVTDRRWEDFRTIITTPPESIGYYLDFQLAASFSPQTNELTISFSVQAKEEAHVFLCDRSVVSQSNCYWFMLHAWSGEKSGFRRCRPYEISNLHTGVGPTGFCRESTQTWRHHENYFPDFLSENRWSNFRIVKTRNEYQLLHQNESKILGVEITPDSDFIPTHLFFHTKRGIGFWKVHKFNYFYTDIAGDYLETKRFFTVSEGQNCLTLFLAMCDQCSMEIKIVTYVGGTEENVLLRTTINTKNQQWKEVKCLFKMGGDQDVFLRFIARSKSIKNNFWAIDRVRSCDVDETRVLIPAHQSAWTKRCQLLQNGMMVDLKSSNKISPLKNFKQCNENEFGENCQACDLIFNGGKCPKNNVYCQLLSEKSGFEQKCYCSIGYQGQRCKGTCGARKYGHGCQKSCGNCQDSCGSDPILGYCNSKYCYNNFVGKKCNIPSGLFVFNDLPEIETGPTSCNVSVKSFDGDGTPNALVRFYKFQYREVNAKNWKDVSKQPLPFNIIERVTISNLELELSYSVRVIGFETEEDLSQLDEITDDEIKFRNFKPSCYELNEDQISIKPDKFSARIFFNISEEHKKLLCDLSKYSFTFNDVLVKKINGQYNLSDLEPDTGYTIAVKRSNNQIFTKTFKTEESVPEEVSNFKVKLTNTSTELNLAWSKPSKTNGVLLFYNIFFQLLEHLACNKPTIKDEFNITLSAGHEEWRVRNLKPYAKYLIQISANTSAGFGPPVAIIVETESSESVKSTEIPELDSTSPGINSVVIKFHAVPCEEISGPLYIDATTTGIQPWCNHSKYLDKKEFINDQLIIEELTPFCKYGTVLKLYRRKEKIEREIDTTNFQTLQSVPNKISEIGVTSKGTNYIALRWLPPYPPTGQVTNYKVSYCSQGSWDTCNEDWESIVEKPTACKLWPDYNCLRLEIKKANHDKTVYTVKVQAKNDDNSEYSEAVERGPIGADDNGKSQPPYGLHMEWSRENYLFLSWYHPNETAGVLTRYIIHISGNVNKEVNHNYTIRSEDEYSLIYNKTIKSGLTFPDEFNIEIAAINLAKNFDDMASISGKSPPPIPEESIESTAVKGESIRIILRDMKLYKRAFKRFLYVAITECAVCEGQLNKYKNNLVMHHKTSDYVLPIESFQPKQWRAIKACDMDKVYSKSLNIGQNSTDIRYPIKRNKNYRIGFMWIYKFGGSIRINSTIIAVEFAFPKTEDASVMRIILPLLGIFITFLILVPIYIRLRKQIHTLFGCTKTPSNESNHYNNIYPAIRYPVPPKLDNSFKRFSRLMPETICPGDPLFKTKNTTRIKLESFEQYVKVALKSNDLNRQHNLFPRGPTKSCTYGALEANRMKNRYKDLVAYNHSRVVLNKIEGVAYSDYINASYIDGYHAPRAYIATQGPKTNTVQDFWRMIWQEKVKNIVALANIYETGKKKMEQYWPNNGEKLIFGDFTVTFLSSEVHANYEYRKFQLLYQYSRPRQIGQLHFKAWPDHGVPLYPQSLVPVLKKMILWNDFPIVVHCSAGVGRTGTVILCDICLRMVAGEGYIDVLAMLEHLRNQRTNMVDNPEQYKLAHLVILNSLRERGTSIPITQNFSGKVEELFDCDKIASQLQYIQDCEWEDEAMKPASFMDDEEMPIVSEKNRFSHIIPDKTARVYLRPYPPSDPIPSSTYINAVQVDAFCEPGRFVVTQFPLTNTIADFWRLVEEKEISVIVCLNDIPISKNCVLFFPVRLDKMSPDETVEIKHVSSKNLQVYSVLTLHMTVSDSDGKAKTRTVEIIKFKGWKITQQVPSDHTDFLTFVEDSINAARKSSPALITCYDGATASGLFIAMSFVMEKIKLEQECDVCQAVRSIRTSRKQFTNDEEQLKFLYKASVLYVEEKFNQYSNMELE